MSLAFDENGRPFIILREQEKKKRVKGLEAHKVSGQGAAEMEPSFQVYEGISSTFWKLSN